MKADTESNAVELENLIASELVGAADLSYSKYFLFILGIR